LYWVLFNITLLTLHCKKSLTVALSLLLPRRQLPETSLRNISLLQQARRLPTIKTLYYLMLGTIVNTATIILGSALGSIIRRGINERYTHALYDALGLCTVVLGCSTCIQHLPESKFPVLFILSMAVGGAVGTALRLDERVNRVAEHVGGSELAKGLTTAILLFCIGTLSMVGPMNSALHGDNTYLYTNATLDFVSSTVLGATYGFGIALAAIVLFCWQGSIYLLTLYASEFLSPELITEISVVGGVLIVGTGISLLNLKNCHTLNLIPALFVPPVFFVVKHLLGF
jgi:uncharacterized membrane protein YqgA involved in biofilm formation